MTCIPIQGQGLCALVLHTKRKKKRGTVAHKAKAIEFMRMLMFVFNISSRVLYNPVAASISQDEAKNEQYTLLPLFVVIYLQRFWKNLSQITRLFLVNIQEKLGTKIYLRALFIFSEK